MSNKDQVIQDISRGADQVQVSLANLTKLTMKNFEDWKWLMRNYFEATGLLECLTIKEITDRSKELKALNILGQSLSVEIRKKLLHCRTSYDLYSGIEKIFESTSAYRCTELHLKLRGYKFTPGKINQGIAEVQDILSELSSLGDKVTKAEED